MAQKLEPGSIRKQFLSVRRNNTSIIEKTSLFEIRADDKLRYNPDDDDDDGEAGGTALGPRISAYARASRIQIYYEIVEISKTI